MGPQPSQVLVGGGAGQPLSSHDTELAVNLALPFAGSAKRLSVLPMWLTMSCHVIL
jgi:hypothetical protein